MPRVALMFALVATACRAAEQPPAPPSVVFEGFGLGDMSTAASVARALRGTAAVEAADGPGLPLDVIVRGPGAGGSPTAPLTAELRGRIERFDVAAGLVGGAEELVERVPRWTGRIGMERSGPEGAAAVEFRTLLESRPGAGRVAVEIGPRIERRVGRGARLFLDGAATAEAVRGDAAADWQFPGTSTADSAAAMGVSARTGIIR